MTGGKQEEGLLGGSREYFIGQVTFFYCCWPNTLETKTKTLFVTLLSTVSKG